MIYGIDLLARGEDDGVTWNVRCPFIKAPGDWL